MWSCLIFTHKINLLEREEKHPVLTQRGVELIHLETGFHVGSGSSSVVDEESAPA
jgi:hypothetical protein